MTSPFPTYEHIFRKWLYPAYNKIKGRNAQEVFLDRRESQYLERRDIQSVQLSKLISVLTNARDHVPYYREEFARIGFVPQDLTSLEEFGKIDFFIDKAIVRDNTKAFLSEECDPRSLNWHRTGGSTGTPLHFPTDLRTDSASFASILKAFEWWDVEIGARHAMFWGSPTFISRNKADIIKQWGNRIRNRMMNRLFFLNYNIGEHNVEEIYRKIERFRPEYIRGMPTSLAIYARLCKKRGLRHKAGSPKFIHSACEQLYDWQKNVIEDVFNSTVLNTYGLSELGDIAFEARCRNLHMMDEDVLVELFPFRGDETEVVATQLNNMASPLIRYRTGDIASSIDTCGCGLNSGTLHGLKGRAHDFVVSPDGKFLHGQFLTHIIVYEPGIQKYQVSQEKPDELNIKLVVDGDYEGAAQGRIRSAIQSYMGPSVKVDFEFVDEIPLTRAGKHRWIISKLGPLDEHI